LQACLPMMIWNAAEVVRGGEEWGVRTGLATAKQEHTPQEEEEHREDRLQSGAQERICSLP